MKHKVAVKEDPVQEVLGETVCGISFSDPHLPGVGDVVLGSIEPGTCSVCFKQDEEIVCPECLRNTLEYADDDMCPWCKEAREHAEDEALKGDSYRIRF